MTGTRGPLALVVTSLCSLSWCGVLVGCAEPATAPAAFNSPQQLNEAQQESPNAVFAATTESPRAPASVESDPGTRALSAACGESDTALISVAKHLAEQPTAAATELDVDAISSALRAAGAPYVWPRAWVFNGNEGETGAAKSRMQRWLASFGDGGARRCGVAVLHEPGARIVVGAVAVDVLADLEAIPTRVRIGQWVDVRARLRVPASDAKLVILGPHGSPHAVPTSLSDGQARARFNADQPGAWLVQLLAAVDGGPRPLLEALVFAGSEPPSEALVPKAPGEEAARSSADPTAASYAMLEAARRSEGLPLLQRDSRLERLAQLHANNMRRVRRTAHDVGDGDLNERLEQMGLALSAGENVAHAGSAILAQRALWASPSHRENLLFPGFVLVGVGVAPDPDGTLWVCQVFAAAE